MHLFASFMLRAVFFLLKDLLFVDGLGLATDFKYRDGSSYFYVDTQVNKRRPNISCCDFTHNKITAQQLGLQARGGSLAVFHPS